jgi:hypothetical protein
MMRYFTADLQARFTSQDEAVALAAIDEWETASDAYWARQKKIGGTLTLTNAVAVQSAYSLHDAIVLGLGKTLDGSSVLLTLQLDSKPKKVLEIKYDVAEINHPVTTVLHPQLKDGDRLRVSTDEFDQVPHRKLMTHSLIMNGVELTITFRRLEVSVKRPRSPVYEHISVLLNGQLAGV